MDRSRLAAHPSVVLVSTAVELIEAAAQPGVSLVLVDLNMEGALDVAALLDEVPGMTAAVVGFGPHVDRDLAARAQAAGFDQALARSRVLSSPLRLESLVS